MMPKTAIERRTLLRARAELWAGRLRVAPRTIRVQRMVHKWGSCSYIGTITLAADLVEQSPDFQEFVIVHELLHLRVPNHGRLFKALMSVHVPTWKSRSVIRPS